MTRISKMPLALKPVQPMFKPPQQSYSIRRTRLINAFKENTPSTTAPSSLVTSDNSSTISYA